MKPSTSLGMATNVDLGQLITLAAAASAGAATLADADRENTCYRGIKVVVDITTFTGTTPTFTVTIEGKDAASGKYYTLLASAALNATGTTVLTVYPSAVVSANVSANDVLPRNFRVRATGGGTITNLTATIGASLLL